MNASTCSPATKLMKLGLLGNAAFSLLSGTALVSASRAIAQLMGVAQPNALAVIGGVLVGYALMLAIAARRSELRVREVLTFSFLDGLWVVGSVVMLATRAVNLSTAGVWVVILVALIVADFTILQVWGALKTRSKA